MEPLLEVRGDLVLLSTVFSLFDHFLHHFLYSSHLIPPLILMVLLAVRGWEVGG